MGDYFTKHHPPHHHRENCATYLYTENALIKINHKVVQEWGNYVLTPNHMVVFIPNHIVVQGCDNFLRTYRQKKPQL